jgi:hypothetical protein
MQPIPVPGLEKAPEQVNCAAAPIKQKSDEDQRRTMPPIVFHLMPASILTRQPGADIHGSLRFYIL